MNISPITTPVTLGLRCYRTKDPIASLYIAQLTSKFGSPKLKCVFCLLSAILCFRSIVPSEFSDSIASLMTPISQ